MPTAVEPVYKDIGRRIENARSGRGLSQSDVARQLARPVTRAAVSNMEGGRQRILVHVLLDIARVLQTDVRELLPPQREQVDSQSLEAALVANGVSSDLARKIAMMDSHAPGSE